MKKVLKTFWSFIKQRKKVAAGMLGVVVIASLTSAIVLAAIPGAGGVIHACYRNNGGSVRIIDDTTETCANNETVISWNQTGPQGPVGPAGPAGSSDVGGKIYSNMVNAPAAENDNNLVELLDIPTMGRFELGRCYYNPGVSSDRKMFFTNTSSHTIYLKPSSDESRTVAPNQTVETFPQMGFGPVPHAQPLMYQYLLTYDDNGDQKVAQLFTGGQVVAANNESVATSCSMSLQAIVSN